MSQIVNHESQFQRFVVTENDGCNPLLPTNQVTSKYAFYKITVFEHPMTEELLDDIELVVQLHTVKPTALPLALPLQLFAPSELIHHYSHLTTLGTNNNGNGSKIAFNNFGTFFPVKDLEKAQDDLIRKVILVRDLQELENQDLQYRGRGLILEDSERERLLQRGHCYATVKDDPQQRVKLVLKPERELQISDTTKLHAERKIRISDREITVDDLSDRQLSRISAGPGGFVIVGNKPIWIVKRNSGEIPKRMTQSPANSLALAPQMAFASGPDFFMTIISSVLNNADHDEFCKFLFTVLSDRRAPENVRVSSGLVNAEFAEWLEARPDEVYNQILRLFLNDPRSQQCSTHDILAPDPKLPVYEIGVVSRYEQEWELLGYSKGSLISSINLAPREELQIEVYSWDKHKLEQEKSFGSEYEFNREINNQTKADTTITRDMKEALGAHADFNGNIGLSAGKVSGGAGVNAGGDWSMENQLATDVNLIMEGSVKSAEKFKTTHRVKIVETHEYGEESRTIRKIQNPNSSRTLTFNYFEILENYRVTTRLADASQFCLLVENPEFPPFDLDFVMAYEYRLQQVLLSSNYKGGFEAARLLAAQRWFDEQSAIEESLNRPDMGPSAQTAADADGSSNGSEDSAPLTGIFATAQNIAEILEAEFINLDIQKALITLSEHHNPLTPSNKTQKEIKDAQADISKYCFWIKLVNIYPGFDQSARKYVEQTAGKFGVKGEETQVINSLKTLADLFDDDWLHSVKMFAASTVLQGIMKLPLLVTGPFAPVIMGLLEPVILPLAYNSDDRGLSKAISSAKKNLLPIVDTQNAVIAHEQVVLPSESFEQAPASPMQVPMLYSYREIAEAHADFTKLLTHLEEHRTYYSNEIWRLEDENERYLRLESLGIARFVENRLLGFAGNKAVYPLIEEALPAEFDLNPFRQDIEQNLNSGQREKQALISVPTPAVHLDTLLGQCDALETYLQERRELDLRIRKSEERQARFEALQAKLELKRLRLRLEQDPPLLDPPDAHPSSEE